MEIIILLVALVFVVVAWRVVGTKEDVSSSPIDTWKPPSALGLDDKPWPYGEKLPEGKIHVKSADVAPGKSEADRVEARDCGCGRSPTGKCVGLHKLTAEQWAVSDQNPLKASSAEVTAENKAKAVAKANKSTAKKTAGQKPAGKRAPAKKKSV